MPGTYIVARVPIIEAVWKNLVHDAHPGPGRRSEVGQDVEVASAWLGSGGTISIVPGCCRAIVDLEAVVLDRTACGDCSLPDVEASGGVLPVESQRHPVKATVRRIIVLDVGTGNIVMERAKAQRNGRITRWFQRTIIQRPLVVEQASPFNIIVV